MDIKLVKESEMKKGKQGKIEDKRWGVAAPAVCISEKSVTILSADKIIECKRRESGLPANCAICQGVSREMFDKCKNKWTEY